MKITAFSNHGRQEISEAELAPTLASDVRVVWVDMTGPAEADLRVLREVFKFHPLAIEDTINHQQRPKIEEYDTYLFGILNPMIPGHDEIAFRELDVFIGRNFLVTVHPAEEPVIVEAERRINHTGSLPLICTGYLLYVLIDAVVDAYFPILDELGEEIDELGDQVVTRPEQKQLNRLFDLKHTLNHIWRVVGPQRDMFNVLTRRDLEYIDQDTLAHYLRDVYDHLLRITDTVNTYRDTLTSIVDLYMSAISNRLNQIVNRLTLITIMTGAFSVIVGFYGMNFQFTWPPLAHESGVLVVLMLMAALGSGLIMIFRRLGWV